MMNKRRIVGMFLVFSLSMCPVQFVQAGIFDKIKIPKVDIEEVVQSQLEKAVITKPKAILDGTYYSGKVEKRFQRKNGVVEENRFVIDKPTYVNFHGINNGYNAAMNFRFYDDDDYQISDKIHIGVNDTKDTVLFLQPGKYKLKVEFFSMDKNGYCDYRFKLNGNPINCDIQREITSTSDAYKIEYNENVKNYFKTIGKWGQDTKSHYYYFNLTSTSSVNILAKKDVIGSCSISLLDADERKIGSEMYFNQDNQINKTFTLNPGIYYLRVERESVLGSIYSIQIK